MFPIPKCRKSRRDTRCRPPPRRRRPLWYRWQHRYLPTCFCRRTFSPRRGRCSDRGFRSSKRCRAFSANTGIIKRHGVKPFEWYLERRGWPERTKAFLEGAEALFVDAAEKALASAQLDGADIDTVVTVCSTGIATPSLEARVAGRMGFRSDVTPRAGVRPRLRRRRLGPVDRGASRRRRGRAPTCCWSRSSSARWRFGSTN